MKFDVCGTGIEISGVIEVSGDELHEDYRHGGAQEEFNEQESIECAKRKLEAKLTAAIMGAGLCYRDRHAEFYVW